MNNYARVYDEILHDISWRLHPLKKNGKVSTNDAIRELCDWGMGGSLLVHLIHIPEEFPTDEQLGEDTMELYEPEMAMKILLEWMHKDGGLFND